MKLLTFFSFITLASALDITLHPELHPIQSLYHSQNFNGFYTYGYATPIIQRNEERSLDGVTRGEYSYMDSNGKQQTVKYTSDPLHGFQVAASNLPQDLPEVAEAKARHLALLNSAPLQLVQDLPEVVAARQAHMAALEAARIGIMPQMVQDTPEVIAARQAHMAAFEAVKSGHIQIIQDTPEVAKAKSEHMAILEATKARDEILRRNYLESQTLSHYKPAVLDNSGLYSYGHVNVAQSGYSFIDDKGVVQTIKYDDGKMVGEQSNANAEQTSKDDTVEIVNTELSEGVKIESNRGGFLINADSNNDKSMLYRQEIQF